ncbi:GDP-mannose mannosyl hydrolase [Shewanella decolorationis]|uniref:Gdp-mannose mannosyl hydrolase n=1 Tax=Shewanella decolorationis S12 TaxID=1353536 RepID=A0ABN0PMK1_9GAMM|nr:GDP-mannose mannosyl hydrolase [Shewanella decolorationis]ESE41260.1 gdp-mannose mannosyl hydrolase [Shewanella decolorationis S12]GLR31679.1 GDP-mannose mannosyl hydrolase WbdQ/WbhG [Shewanella decolorationis]
MFLDQPTFSTVIASTPLVSIDLVVTNSSGQVLLGQRLNRPAKDYWFVPGGRILKNESLANAFKRLTRDELGQEFTIDQATLLGPFDHFYTDNVFSSDVFGDDESTHYVAIAFTLQLDGPLANLPLAVQHGGYHWFDVPSLLADPKVHLHTKWYFDKTYTELMKD